MSTRFAAGYLDGDFSFGLAAKGFVNLHQTISADVCCHIHCSDVIALLCFGLLKSFYLGGCLRWGSTVVSSTCREADIVMEND